MRLESTDIRNGLISLAVGIILFIAGVSLGDSMKNLAILGGVIVFITFVVLFVYQRYKLKKLESVVAQQKKLGIIGCEEVLEASPLTPTACMVQTTRYLDFMGILGSKWVQDEESVEKFRILLRRVTVNKGQVRFLLLNPLGRATEELAKARGLNIATYRDAPSISRYLALADEFDCMEVRLFDYLPYMRLIFMDNQTMAIARYRIQGGPMEHWKAPHLRITQESEENMWSLYQAFSNHFEYIWTTSKDIREIFPKH